MNDEGTNPLFAIDDGFTIVHKGESHAGASLRERVDRAVARLCDLGVRPGDRVAMCGPKSVDLCVLMHPPKPTRAASVLFSVMHTGQWQRNESSFSGGFPIQNV
jgi:hypothetical protein